MAFMHGHRLYRKLLEAGIVSEPEEHVRRCTIVMELGEAVRIEIELFPDEKVADVLLENLEVQA